MLDHLALQCDDLAVSRRFYERLLAPLGVTVTMDFEDVLGLAGPDGMPRFWLGRTQGGVQREVHVAFAAQDRATVDAGLRGGPRDGRGGPARATGVARVPRDLLRRLRPRSRRQQRRGRDAPVATGTHRSERRAEMRLTGAELLEHCLAKPGAWQDEPWDGDMVAKVGDKIFAFLVAASRSGSSAATTARRPTSWWTPTRKTSRRWPTSAARAGTRPARRRRARRRDPRAGRHVVHRRSSRSCRSPGALPSPAEA